MSSVSRRFIRHLGACPVPDDGSRPEAGLALPVSALDVEKAQSRLHLSVLALAVFMLLFGTAAGAAWDFQNRVVIEHGALTIDHSKSVKEITAAQAKGGFKADLGVGLFQNRLKTELAFAEVSLPGKRVYLTTRIVTAPIIYVARELPKDSCAYQLVLGHEFKHQEYDLEVLRAMPDEIRFITRDIFSVEELERAKALDQKRAMGRFFQQFNYVYQALGEMRHTVIDSPESYRRLGEMCNGEVGKLLGAKPRY